ncbi:MAG: hypothetical protein ACREEB_16430 [Caulobacteraceae bacterium]
MRKLTLYVSGAEVEQHSPAIYERQITSTGAERLLIAVPTELPDLFLQLARILPAPSLVLYILHTPRGEGEPGRYQSPELSWDQIQAFIVRYGAYLAGDARHDVWIYSPDSGLQLIWDRHNYMFVEGQPLDNAVAVLASLGFSEAHIDRMGDHVHHYRHEFDRDAAELLAEFDWLRTPLRPEDEQ